MRTAVVLFLAILPLSGEETWSELRLAGKHIGWSHETTEPAKDGDQDLVRTIEEGKAWLGEPPEEFLWRTEYVETAGGKAFAFSYEGSQGDKPLPEIHGERDGEGMKFATVQGGKVIEEVRDEEVLFPLGSRLLVKSKGFAPGTRYTCRQYSAEERKVVPVESEVVGDAELALPEGPTRAHLVKATQKGSMVILFEVHYDDEGNILCLNGTDIQYVLIRSTRERATAVPGHENK